MIPSDSPELNEEVQDALLLCLEDPKGVRSEKVASLLIQRGVLNDVRSQKLFTILSSGKISRQTMLLLLAKSESLSLSAQASGAQIVKMIPGLEDAAQVQALLYLQNYVALVRPQLEELIQNGQVARIGATLIRAYLQDDSVAEELRTLQEEHPQIAEEIIPALAPRFVMKTFTPLLHESRESEVLRGLDALRLFDLGDEKLPDVIVSLLNDARLSVRLRAAALVVEARPQSELLIEILRQLFITPKAIEKFDAEPERYHEVLLRLLEKESLDSIKVLAHVELCKNFGEHCS